MKISEYNGEPKRRNFVKKNIVKTGAGRHKDKKKDYQRKPKHKKDYRNDQ